MKRILIKLIQREAINNIEELINITSLFFGNEDEKLINLVQELADILHKVKNRCAELRGTETLHSIPRSGRVINTKPSLSLIVLELKARVPVLEKMSRKTPPKHLTEEKKKVEEAKVELVRVRAELEEREADLKDLNELLEKRHKERKSTHANT